MSGMAMMLRSLGFDPEQVTGQIQQFMTMLQEHNDRLERMEKQQDEIIRLLTEKEENK